MAGPGIEHAQAEEGAGLVGLGFGPGGALVGRLVPAFGDKAQVVPFGGAKRPPLPLRLLGAGAFGTLPGLATEAVGAAAALAEERAHWARLGL